MSIFSTLYIRGYTIVKTSTFLQSLLVYPDFGKLGVGDIENRASQYSSQLDVTLRVVKDLKQAHHIAYLCRLKIAGKAPAADGNT